MDEFFISFLKSKGYNNCQGYNVNSEKPKESFNQLIQLTTPGGYIVRPILQQDPK